MRSLSPLLVVIAALQLGACQLMSGLDKLHAEPATQEHAQRSDAGPASETEHVARRDGGANGNVMISNTLPEDDGDPEHVQPMEPAPDDAVPPRDSDAGVEPSDKETEAARSGLPLAKSDGGVVGPAVHPVDAGSSERTDETAGAPQREEPQQPAERQDNAPACVPPPPAGPACTTAPQCGCDMGENCAVADDELACVSIGTAEVNQPCDGPKDCALGLQCLSGACLKLCDESEPDCGGGADCVQLHARDGHSIEGAHICESNCNLADPNQAHEALNACGPGLVCVWSGTGSFCARSDRARKQHGEHCADVSECAPGFVCTEHGTCAQWCASGSACPEAFSCNLDSPVQIGQTSFGTCRPDCLGRNESVCGLSNQCGCDTDHSCDAVVNHDNQLVHECRDLGPVPLHETCSVSTDCGRRAQCVSNECQPMCQTNAECDRYSRCELGFFNSAPSVVAGATCRRPCDPAEPSRAHGLFGSCRAGEACDVTSDGASQCRAATPRGVAGVTCSANSDCAVGFTCTSEHACVQLCRGDGDCRGGTCRGFATSQFATNVEWGSGASGS